MAKNTRNINSVFNKRAVLAHEPDTNWPLSNEFIGLEIEVEDFSGDRYSVEPEWTTHADGSLRNGIEFVLAGPTGGRNLTAAINKFFDAGFRYNMSERTSTHIHINASDNMSFDKFRNMFVVMYLIEPAVFRWADDNRKWCGYCCPLTDLAPARLVPLLTDNSNEAQRFIRAVQGSGNSDRYYGYNMAAFARHGTVEFRYFPCTDNKERIIEWTRFVMFTKKTALSYDSPEDILAACSDGARLEAFINNNFGDVAHYIIRNLDFADAVARANELLHVLNVPAASVDRTSYYRTTESRGLTKLIARKFSDNREQARPTTVNGQANPADGIIYDSWTETYNRIMEAERQRRAAQQNTVSGRTIAPTVQEYTSAIFTSTEPATPPARPRRRTNTPSF